MSTDEDLQTNDTKKSAWRKQVSRNCSILYDKPRARLWSKSVEVVPFSFECRDGWAEPLKKLSYELEMLNKTYGLKNHIKIEATQVKEKFGTLCFYYDAVRGSANVLGAIAESALNALASLLQKVNYQMKMKIVYTNESDEEVVEQPTTLDIDDYLDQLDSDGKISTSLYKGIAVKDGQIVATKVIHKRSTHTFEATKHKVLHKLYECLLDFLGSHHFATEQQIADQDVVEEFMRNRADDLIAKAEEECQHVCEECGRQIGTTWSPICETVGWIAYLCDKCADKCGFKYIKDGAMYCDGKLIKSEAEVLKEQAVNELKSVKRQAEYEEKQKLLISKKREEVEKLIAESLNIENKGQEYPLT